VDQAAFPDHHPFRPAELQRLLRRAADLGAIPVTTPKDAVRLPPAIRDQVRVAGVSLRWADAEQIERLLEQWAWA
jgi:tetraacyldisaccharide 4'-kinase